MKTQRSNRWVDGATWRVAGSLLVSGAFALGVSGCGSEEEASTTSSTVSVDNCSSSAAVGSVCDSTKAQSLSKSTVSGYDEADDFDAITSVSDISTAVEDYRISYQTQYDNYAAENNRKVTATGRVLLPDGDISSAPLLIWGHGTTGTADKCAPSRTKSGLDKHAYQYAARGFVVFAPDYAGLGVSDEMHYYLVKEPTALSIWDGAYAAKAFVESQGGSLSGSVVLLGHSQGGQAVLFAHQYYSDAGANSHLDSVATDFSLKATVAAAPAPQWIKALAIANTAFAAALGVTDPTLAFMLATSYIHAAADYYGLDESLLLSTTSESAVSDWYEDKCQTELGGLVEAGNSPLSSDATVAFQAVLGNQTTGVGTLAAAASACLSVAGLAATGDFSTLSSCKEPGTTTSETNPAELTADIAGWYGLVVSGLNGTGAAWGTRLMKDGTGTSLAATSAYGQVFTTAANIYITQGDADDLVPASLNSILYSELNAANSGKVTYNSIAGGDHTSSISTFQNGAFSYVQKIFESVQ